MNDLWHLSNFRLTGHTWRKAQLGSMQLLKSSLLTALASELCQLWDPTTDLITIVSGLLSILVNTDNTFFNTCLRFILSFLKFQFGICFLGTRWLPASLTPAPAWPRAFWYSPAWDTWRICKVWLLMMWLDPDLDLSSWLIPSWFWVCLGPLSGLYSSSLCFW